MDSTSAPDLSSPTLSLGQNTPTNKTPSKKRTRWVKFDEVYSAFGRVPEDFKAAWYDLRARLDDIPARPEITLAPTSLKSVREALLLFNLREGNTNPFAGVQSSPVPLYLEQNIARIDSVTNGGERRNNEAFFRMIIDQILVCCLYEEGQRSDQQSPKQATDTDKVFSRTPPRTSDTNAEREDPAELLLLHKTQLSRVVTHYGQTKQLSGYADYSVWYDSTIKGQETMATNLLIVEAKPPYYTDVALPQLACYMGIVHASRKAQSKENCIVYGAASDGSNFRFCQIDNDGVFNRSALLEWDWNKNEIYSIIRSLLRAAALSSPSTTPIKDPLHRKIVLASFGSPERTRRFDYDFGELRTYDESEIEEGDEIVHLSQQQP